MELSNKQKKAIGYINLFLNKEIDEFETPSSFIGKYMQESIKYRDNGILTERQKALMELLKPITWCPSSSISSRQNKVVGKYKEVSLVYPFLNKYEKLLADVWREEEKHSGLWY